MCSRGSRGGVDDRPNAVSLVSSKLTQLLELAVVLSVVKYDGTEHSVRQEDDDETEVGLD